jgi:cell division transport system ATP-binding protein
MSELIHFNNVTIFQDDRPVAGEVNLSVNKGEFIYLLGKTGSGKSTFLRALYADVPVKMGGATVCGFDLTKLRQKDIPFLRRKLGIVFQDFQLLGDRNVFNNLRFVMKATGWKGDAKIKERITELIQKTGLVGKELKMPHELSGGEQQRVSIARALINDPEIIIADEPTGNLDPEASEEILKLLRELSSSGRTILFATHDMLVYNKYKSRTLLFENGKVHEGN